MKNFEIALYDSQDIRQILNISYLTNTQHIKSFITYLSHLLHDNEEDHMA